MPPEIFTGVGSAAVQGGLGIIGSGLNYLFNKKLAQQQNQFNIDMWKMQADYNSPQSQMKRFQQAGLNPNLIYGQGSSGNMSNAPQMVVPEAPELSKEMQELGKAFNIEQIRTLIADRKKAQADAKAAEINAERERTHFEADKELGATYQYDVTNGMFKRSPVEGWYAVDNDKAKNYYLMQHLADNYQRNMLLNSRAQLLNAQYRYLQPQILMSNFEQKHQPLTYYIGQGTKVLTALPLPKFNFKFGYDRKYYPNY